ncbi:MAG: hypothetical protein ACRCX8_10260 [Sarcina sp.]
MFINPYNIDIIVLSQAPTFEASPIVMTSLFPALLSFHWGEFILGESIVLVK